MQIINPLEFTEHHRFYTFRDFSLSPIDRKMLLQVYQPMIGSLAVHFYELLFQQLAPDQFGYSPLESQRGLFLTLGLELGDKGRRQLIECTSGLEAVGLLETQRRHMAGKDEYVYGYRLKAPLSPVVFFRTQHLTMLLQDQVGKYMTLSLRDRFSVPASRELQKEAGAAEDLTVPFYEWFRLNPFGNEFEEEEEHEEAEWLESDEEPVSYHDMYSQGLLDSADLLSRYPRLGNNRTAIEQLRHRPDDMASINYIVQKYDLTLEGICRLLDEDGVFNREGHLDRELLQHKGGLVFRQDKRREATRERVLTKSLEPDYPQKAIQPVASTHWLEVPSGLEQAYTPESYSFYLKNKPYTQVLKLFFPGEIPDHLVNLFEMIDINYKLKEEVINVLIHYLKTAQLSWNRKYVESIVSDLLGKGVDRYELAVDYVRSQMNRKQGKQQKASAGFEPRKATGGRKPKLPVITPSHEEEEHERLSEQEYNALLQKAKQLEG